ncbi:alpha/beta fold hydrolase [Phaeobacter sp.]|uniref:alpha/beta fold hydrolase n=1 Tax=Phaeobacter sp. TaxID=1902409 RepID=UPI0025F156DA|nr:alpha/beta fold hydrolase [Phaeobacter sp.]
MLFELAYPGLCAWAVMRRIAGRPVPAGPMFAFRAIRGRMRRYELSALAALNPRWGAWLALHRFERMVPKCAETPAGSSGLAERRFGPMDGPKVLLLHGWNARSDMMLPLALELAARGARVIVPDLPGEGRNPAQPMSFDAKARILAAQYRSEAIQTVVGHSAGGLIAALAVETGLHRARLITICAPYSMETLLQAYLFRIGAPETLETPLMSHIARRDGRDAARMGPELYAAMGARLLVIHARRDWQVRLSEAEAICAVAPAASLQVLENCNHHTIMADPGLFDAVATAVLPVKTPRPCDTSTARVCRRAAITGAQPC